MTAIADFRDPVAARGVLSEIARLAKKMGANRQRPLRIMEICGGHTHAIFRHGLDKLVHEGIEFIHGPGCPVCVLPMTRIDDAIEIAERPGVLFTAFGDVMPVPGLRGTLLQAKARGADIRALYSPLDALALARNNRSREIVFFGLGFETTAPATALAIQQAACERIDNFSVFCNHITVPEPVRALLADPGNLLDGFIGPGHVSMVIGLAPYEFIAREFGKPVVIAGFEPLDLLHATLMTLRQIAEGRAEVENQYTRVVPRQGNPVSLAAMADVFEPRPSFQWRGLGKIEASGLCIRQAYARFDAERKFGAGYGAENRQAAETEGCACGAVMTGRIKPTACPHYGGSCTPDTPLGALMVSSEGACAAYWHYGGARSP